MENDCIYDRIVDRRGTDCVKWDDLKNRFGREDLLPMWVADMDFKTPDFITDSIREMLDRGVLGYTFIPDSWYDSIISWLDRRHAWKIRRECLTYVPGIVRGLAYVLRAFTKEGDKVMVMPPVYFPFFNVSMKSGREVVYSPLVMENGTMNIDFDRFRKDIAGCKALILCNPHNPGGRVWTENELKTIAEIAYDNGTLVISDEIHADLTLKPYRHHPFSMVSEKAAANSVVMMAPSKAFNMPGISSSYCIIEDDRLREIFRKYMDSGDFAEGHMFAYRTVSAAYDNGAEWLDRTLEYISGNIDYVERFLENELPQVGMIRPQASFLIFLDCRRLGLDREGLDALFLDKAHLALNNGAMFGEGGEGFMRLNVGVPASVLEKAMLSLKSAVQSL